MTFHGSWENDCHCACLPRSAPYIGLICPGLKWAIGMCITDPTVTPSFNLAWAKTGGLLTVLGTSGVGDVDKEWLMWVCWRIERFLIGTLVVDGDISDLSQYSNEEAKRWIKTSAVSLPTCGFHNIPKAQRKVEERWGWDTHKKFIDVHNLGKLLLLWKNT